MAIPCKTCDQPVHEQAFVCPHCGDESGVPRDPEAARQVAAMRKVPASPPSALVMVDLDPLAAVVAGGVALVLDLIRTEDEPEPVPRAIARERSAPVATKAREPEPVEPPAEQPRILK